MAWIRIIGASLTLLVDRCLASVPDAGFHVPHRRGGRPRRAARSPGRATESCVWRPLTKATRASARSVLISRARAFLPREARPAGAVGLFPGQHADRHRDRERRARGGGRRAGRAESPCTGNHRRGNGGGGIPARVGCAGRLGAPHPGPGGPDNGAVPHAARPLLNSPRTGPPAPTRTGCQAVASTCSVIIVHGRHEVLCRAAADLGECTNGRARASSHHERQRLR